MEEDMTPDAEALKLAEDRLAETDDPGDVEPSMVPVSRRLAAHVKRLVEEKARLHAALTRMVDEYASEPEADPNVDWSPWLEALAALGRAADIPVPCPSCDGTRQHLAVVPGPSGGDVERMVPCVVCAGKP